MPPAKPTPYRSSFIALWLALLLVAVIWFVLRSATSTTSSSADDDYVTGMNVEYSLNRPVPAPELTGLTTWINSDPLTLESLRGKVVLIDFWTYSCINCIRTLPHMTKWDETYRDDGLVIIGVHAPEFAFEQKTANVQEAVDKYNIQYPVALDNNFATWRAYSNRYWPAKYFIDHTGQLRHTHFGEGDYGESEAVIRQLLAEAGAAVTADSIDETNDQPPTHPDQTAETYLGYARYEEFANRGDAVKDAAAIYTAETSLSPGEWTIGGEWLLTEEYAESQGVDGQLQLQFSGKDVYLVMGSDTSTVMTLRLNGEPITPDQGGGRDLAADGTLAIDSFRLYHLVSLPDFTKNATLELIVPAGLQLHAFTFGGQ